MEYFINRFILTEILKDFFQVGRNDFKWTVIDVERNKV